MKLRKDIFAIISLMKNLLIVFAVLLVLVSVSQQSCFSSIFCSSPKPFCVDYECSQCKSNYDCAGALTVCMKGSCKDCLKDIDCKLGSMRKCSPSNTCVECLQKTDCTSPALPYCPSNKCVECIQNSDCTGTSDTCVNNVCACGTSQRCKLSCQQSQCLECLVLNDCPPNLLCSSKNKCVQCLSKSDCKGYSIAKCSNNVCQEKCTVNEDCTDNSDNCNKQSFSSQGSNGKCYCGSSSPCKIACSNGQCLQCRTKDDCPSGKQCSSLNMCVDCVQDSNCGGSLPKCFNNSCAQCSVKGDCTGKTDTCVNGTCQCGLVGVCTIGCVKGQCVQCLEDGQCGTSKKCSPLNICVQCVNDSQCLADKLKCQTATGLCKQCNVNSHCTGKTDTCNDGTCNCGIFGPCDSYCINGQCVECMSTADCKNTKICSSKNQCVQCNSDQDCPIKPKKCQDNVCLQCNENGHCKGKGDSCLNGVCKCGNTAICDKFCNDNGQCEDCKIDQNCFWGNRKYCLQKSRCVECISNDQCSSDQKCFQNACSQCAVNSDCTGATDTCINGVCQCGGNSITCTNKKQCLNGQCSSANPQFQPDDFEENIQNMIQNVRSNQNVRKDDILSSLAITLDEMGKYVTSSQQIQILEIMNDVIFKTSSYSDISLIAKLADQLIQLKQFTKEHQSRHKLNSPNSNIDIQFNNFIQTLHQQLEIQMINRLTPNQNCEKEVGVETLLFACRTNKAMNQEGYSIALNLIIMAGYNHSFLDDPNLTFKVKSNADAIKGVAITQISKRPYSQLMTLQSNIFQITLFLESGKSFDENVILTFSTEESNQTIQLQEVTNNFENGEVITARCQEKVCTTEIKSSKRYFVVDDTLISPNQPFIQTNQAVFLILSAYLTILGI